MDRKAINKIQQGRYSTAFLNLSLLQLIDNYEKIEKGIEESLVNTFLTYLEESNCKIKGNAVEVDQCLYNVSIESSNQNQCLVLSLINTERKETLKDFQIEIREFGRIKQVQIKLPKQISGYVETLLPILKEQLILAYSSLEIAYLNKVEDITAAVFKNLHDIIFGKAKSLNSYDLINGHFWFDVTNLEKKKCKNFVTKEMLSAIISHLKKSQILVFSPFVLVSHFLTSEVPESLTSEALKNGLETISIPMLNKYKLNHSKVWTLENIILNKEDCQAHLICNVKNEWLQIAYPRNFEIYFKDILDKETKSELEEQFRSNYRFLSRLKEKVNGLKERVSSNSQGSFLMSYSKDIMGDMLLKDRIKDIMIMVIKNFVN